MKKITLYKALLIAAAPAMMLSSCDYLDVQPNEKVDEDDVMKDANAVRDYLYSCYDKTSATNELPCDYHSFEAATDEFICPAAWEENRAFMQWNQMTATEHTSFYWNDFYYNIGQCYHFLLDIDRYAPAGFSEETKKAYKAEANFLIAFYHMRLLNAYGPIPLIKEYQSANQTTDQFPGRSPYDECVKFIVDKFDEAIQDLPETRDTREWGRATKTIARAMKSRLLLYAASPMWNGSFPFVGWTNKDGSALVNNTEDRSKWQTALDAALEAIQNAEAQGFHLLTSDEGVAIAELLAPDVDEEELESKGLTSKAQAYYCWVPGVVNDPADPNYDEEFFKTILALRYVHNTTPNQGNKEIIWATYGQENASSWMRRQACLPRNIGRTPNKDDKKTANGWMAESPTLYSVEHFLTKDGTLPDFDPKFGKDDSWKFASANIPNEEKQYTPYEGGDKKTFEIRHTDIININVNREPRFYASFSFDGDMMFSRIRGGEPLWLNIKSENEDGKGDGDGSEGGQGVNADSRDYCVCGYFTKKWNFPHEYYNTESGTDSWGGDRIMTLLRIAELYLNAAECYAELGQTDKALEYVNKIRRRAYVRDLTSADLANMSIVDWVRNERFIELWGEGLRYYDLRRWLIAPERLSTSAYEGLCAKYETMPIPFEVFNKRTKVSIFNGKLQWDDRMYLMAVPSVDVYANPQMVQAPKY